jgi:hypothetical protein
LNPVYKSFDKHNFFTKDADIFYFRIADQVMNFRLINKSLYLDKEGRYSSWSLSTKSYDHTAMNTSQHVFNRSVLVNMPEQEKHWTLYPNSKYSDEIYTKLIRNQTIDVERFSSQILAEEMDGFNTVASM